MDRDYVKKLTRIQFEVIVAMIDANPRLHDRLKVYFGGGTK